MSISEIKRNVEHATGHLKDSVGSEWVNKTISETYAMAAAPELIEKLKETVGGTLLIDPGSAIPISLGAERAQDTLGDTLVGMSDTERVDRIHGSLVRIGVANEEKNAAYTAMMEKRDKIYGMIETMGAEVEEFRVILGAYTARGEEQVHLRDATIEDLGVVTAQL